MLIACQGQCRCANRPLLIVHKWISLSHSKQSLRILGMQQYPKMKQNMCVFLLNPFYYVYSPCIAFSAISCFIMNPEHRIVCATIAQETCYLCFLTLERYVWVCQSQCIFPQHQQISEAYFGDEGMLSVTLMLYKNTVRKGKPLLTINYPTSGFCTGVSNLMVLSMILRMLSISVS